MNTLTPSKGFPAISQAGGAVSAAVDKGARALLEGVKVRRFLEDNSLVPKFGWRVMLLDIDMMTGEVHAKGGWVYAERMQGAVGDRPEQELYLVAAGGYRKAEGGTPLPVVVCCAALETKSFELILGVRLNADGTRGAELTEPEVFSALTGAADLMAKCERFSKQREAAA